jgi:prepilin-type processing-associated H-X9-DG protein
MVISCDNSNRGEGRQKQFFCRFPLVNCLQISSGKTCAASNRFFQRAFTRLDLMAGMAVVLILIGWFGFSYLGEQGRIAKCAKNLALLGQLTQEYANDHAGSLPPASIESKQLAWDMQIAPYLAPSQVKNGMDPYFLCPSDHLNRSRPRSYAMAAHDMTRENWPPGSDNETGVGLVWNNDSLKRLLGEKAITNVVANLDSLAMVKLSSISAPADTLLYTDLIHRDNELKGIKRAAVPSPGEQLEAFNGDGSRFHRGRFNYLMLDGHVEWLSPLQTGSSGGYDAGPHHGIWTIKAKD